MRKTYRMTADQLETMRAASKPTPVMYLSGGVPMAGTPQENANAAWARLADELKFDVFSVRPHPSGEVTLFTAESKE